MTDLNDSIVIVTILCFCSSESGQQFLTRSFKFATHLHHVRLQFFDYPTRPKPPFPVEQGELPDRTTAPKMRLGRTSSSQPGSNTTRRGMRRIRGRRWSETMTMNM
nr:uncharacterized protein LOC112277358 [Physcomitrium patens]|eukprot:XP_024365319.1 uncharacterized protein LOC112277358 [Physcomitrella patens]